MNIEKAVDNLKWRISDTWKKRDINSLSDNAKKLMEREFNSIGEVIKYVNAKESKQINNNELLAKLYIHFFTEYAKKNQYPIKEMHRLLSLPLSVHIQNYTNKLNDVECENLFSDYNLSKEHPATIPQEIKDKETDILQHAVKDKENADRLFRNVWNPETVKELLYNQINHFLNTYYNDKTTRHHPNF